MIDSKYPICVGGKNALNFDFSKKFEDQYPDAAEDIDSKVPDRLIYELQINVLVDSNHAHDKSNRRSITGLSILVGRTPMHFMSKLQVAIATITHGAEVCAMMTAV